MLFLREPLGKDLLLDDYTTLHKRLRKLKVRSLLRQRAKYFEQKIDPASQCLDEIIASLKSGVWQTSSLENIPLITTYALIHWIFDYPRQSSGYGFPFDRPYLDFYRRLQKAHQVLSLHVLKGRPGSTHHKPHSAQNICRVKGGSIGKYLELL